MFTPDVGALLTITLPGEKLRATVRHVESKDSVICELTGQPMARSHNFKLHDVVICLRKKMPLEEIWEAQGIRNPNAVTEVKDNAAETRIEPKDGERKHIRANTSRKQAKESRSNRGNSSQQRKKASARGKRG